MNGGNLTGGGSLEYANGTLRNTDLKLAAKGVFMEFPAALRTVSDIDLRLIVTLSAVAGCRQRNARFRLIPGSVRNIKITTRDDLAGHPHLDLPEPAGPASGAGRSPGPGVTPGSGEPDLGLPPDPG